METKRRLFSYNNKNFEVRAVPFTDGWKVRVFQGTIQATSITYTVSHEDQMDADLITREIHLVDGLMELAENDVKNNIVKLVSLPY
jgi:hypothetical protein